MGLQLELKKYFDKDDGFLPEIAFTGYKKSEVSIIYKTLCLISENCSLDSVLWHIPTQSEMKLSQFSCAVNVMLDGDAEPFHMMFVNPKYNGVTLPDLGAFISNTEIIIDYRRGDSWSEIELYTLLVFIKKEMKINSNIIVKHQECEELLNLNLAVIE